MNTPCHVVELFADVFANTLKVEVLYRDARGLKQRRSQAAPLCGVEQLRPMLLARSDESALVQAACLHPDTFGLSQPQLFERIDVIQHPVRRDFGQHDAVGDAQQGVTRPTVQMIHQVMNHHIDRGQRFDQINHEGFGRSLWVDGKQSAGCTRGGFDVGN